MHVDKLFVFEFVINISWVVIQKVLLFWLHMNSIDEK